MLVRTERSIRSILIVRSSTSGDHHSETRPVPGLLGFSTSVEDHPDAYNPGTRDHEQDGNHEIGRRYQAAADVELLGVRPTHEPETNDENDESERLDFGGRKATARRTVHARFHHPDSSYVFRREATPSADKALANLYLYLEV